MDEDNIITLNDENGNEVEFEFLDLIPYRQNEYVCLLYTSPSPRDTRYSRMPSSA